MSKMISRIGLVSAMTMLSRVFGLFRDILITAVFGASLWNSAFTTAFTLPSLFRRLLGEGALSAALMPHLSEEMEASGKPAVFKLLNKTLSWLFVVCSILIGIAYLVFEYIEKNAVSENWILAAELAKILFPYILLICMAAIVSAGLNLLGRFAIPAMTAVWLNVSILLLLGLGAWLWSDEPRDRMNFLCVGVLIGGTLQLLAPAFALKREGWVPRFDFGVSSRLKAVLLLTLPGVYGAAAHQINVMVSRGLALNFNESGAALINLANRLVELPMGVFVIAISTVAFPALSQARASGDRNEFGEIYRNGISLSLMMAIPAAVGLSMLAPEIIGALFQRGQFSAADTVALTPILVICACGVPFLSFVSIATRAFYSRKDTKTPVKGSSIGLVVNIVLSLVLLRTMGRIEALVIASNVAIAVQSIYLHLKLRFQGDEARLGPVVPKLAIYLFASVLMGGTLWLGEWTLNRFDLGQWRSAAVLVLLIPMGSFVYFATLKARRVGELEQVLESIGRKRSEG